MILEGAYALAKEEGFSELTARGIAKKLNMSTQPIYLAFENMDVLRNALMDTIFEELRASYFSTSQTIVEFTLNYYQFAVDYTELHLSLLTDTLTILPFQRMLFRLFCEITETQTTFSAVETQVIFARIMGTVSSLSSLKLQIDNQSMIKKILSQAVQADTEQIQQLWTAKLEIG